MALPVPRPDSTCLVTGASSGIGAELARELARRGLGLTLVARREERLRALAAELAETFRVRTEYVTADLTDQSSRAEVATKVRSLGLNVEVLVNNAGLTTVGTIDRADRASELAMIRTDVEAVVDLCTLFVPPMVERGRGAVLNTASTAAFQPLPGQAGYAAAKAFVLSYSWAIGAELKDKGVTVTALCPGPVATGFAEVAGVDDEVWAAWLPRFMWVSAPAVARAAVEGLERNKPVVIPGTPNRFGALAAHIAPRRAVTAVLTRQHPAFKMTGTC
jgi:short-subunit dehydrogenase